MDRSDQHVPAGRMRPADDQPATDRPATDRPATDRPDSAEAPPPVIALGPGDDEPAAGPVPAADPQQPTSLDPERDDVDRNAAGGGWGGATEQVENDFETEQLRRREDAAG